MTNDVPAAPGGSSFAASSGSDGAQTASPATVTPPAAVLNLAIQVGDCLLSAGMSANDVVVAMLGVTDAYGLTRVHVDVTYTSISASYYPTRGTPPITCIRVVQPDDIDYSKVREVARLEEKIRAGLPIDEATRAFDRIQEAPHRYSQWVAMIGNAGVSAGAAVLFTTSWKIILATFLTGLIVDRMLAAMEHWRVPPFFQQFAGAGFITLVAAGIAEAAAQGVSFFVGVDPTLVVVGGIIMLVAGMTIVGAAQDAIDQFYVTASARLLDVTMRHGRDCRGDRRFVRAGIASRGTVGHIAQSRCARPARSPARWRHADICILRAVGVCRSGDDRARGRDGPAGLGWIYVDDLRWRTRGTRQHRRRFRRGAGVHLADPPLNDSRIRPGQRCPAPVGTRPRPLQRSVASGRNLTGDSQSDCRWVNSVARARCRFGHSGWRHPRDLSRTADRGPASPYPNAPQSIATQVGRANAKKSASVGIAPMTGATRHEQIRQ